MPSTTSLRKSIRTTSGTTRRAGRPSSWSSARTRLVTARPRRRSTSRRGRIVRRHAAPRVSVPPNTDTCSLLHEAELRQVGARGQRRQGALDAKVHDRPGETGRRSRRGGPDAARARNPSRCPCRGSGAAVGRVGERPTSGRRDLVQNRHRPVEAGADQVLRDGGLGAICSRSAGTLIEHTLPRKEE